MKELTEKNKRALEYAKREFGTTDLEEIYKLNEELVINLGILALKKEEARAILNSDK